MRWHHSMSRGSGGILHTAGHARRLSGRASCCSRGTRRRCTPSAPSRPSGGPSRRVGTRRRSSQGSLASSTSSCQRLGGRARPRLPECRRPLGRMQRRMEPSGHDKRQQRAPSNHRVASACMAVMHAPSEGMVRGYASAAARHCSVSSPGQSHLRCTGEASSRPQLTPAPFTLRRRGTAAVVARECAVRVSHAREVAHTREFGELACVSATCGRAREYSICGRACLCVCMRAQARARVRGRRAL